MLHAQCRVHIFHHIIFYFPFRQLIVFPVWSQFCCACQGEKSSTIFSGNTSQAAPGALTHRLQCRIACNAALPATPHRLQSRTACNVAPPAKSKVAARGPQNGRRGPQIGQTLGYWTL